ncbi:hypothetical protein MKW92_034410 [Papaver armeniacum]|nr:hypothetical protein MKW92_034410 [Papaver armeniacum]
MHRVHSMHEPLPTDILEMIPWDGCKAKQIASPKNIRLRWVIRWYTISICLLELLLTTYVLCYHFQLDNPLIQLEQDFKWIIFFYFHWRLGIDGISIGPILLTGFITTLATLAARPVTRDLRLFYFSMLAMYIVRINSCLPTFIMYVCGGEAFVLSYKVYFVHCRGFYFLLMGVLGMGLYASNEPTLNLETLANQSYPVALEIIFYFGFVIAYAVKSPIIPLHTWLPDTHGEAHYSTCILLAGILLKMGAYGLVRINMELLPHVHSIFNISWATQFKKRIAYSSRISYGFYNYMNSLRNRYGDSTRHLQIISHEFKTPF